MIMVVSGRQSERDKFLVEYEMTQATTRRSSNVFMVSTGSIHALLFLVFLIYLAVSFLILLLAGAI